MAEELFGAGTPPPTNNLPPPQSGGTPKRIGEGMGPPGGPHTPGAKADAMAPPTGVGPNGPPPEYNGEEFSEEEVAIYDQLVTRSRQMITSGAGGIIDLMNKSDKPAYENIGRTGAMILTEVEKLAKAKGVEVDTGLMISAGTKVVDMLMEVGDAAGIWPFEKGSDEAKEAAIMALYHGAELAGNTALAGPDGPQMQQEAGDAMAMEIAKESEAGTLHPEFDATMARQFTGAQ